MEFVQQNLTYSWVINKTFVTFLAISKPTITLQKLEFEFD